MANTFKRKLSRAIGATATQVGTYAVPSATTTIVIGLTVTNTSGSAISANVFINDGSANTSIVTTAPISSGSSLVLVGGDQKIVLETADSIYVQSSAASSIDVVMSIMEST
jgi:hypothetical protein